ncbi:VgrG-related protein [Clostridium lacusfryxellense]|uniref:VgrG-related protein n=1 Tax=Clostridium lacusfryxellense TaxID=205328 RepID=UPI001C0ADD8B|nr:vgrg protein [Clostridium lacusfryxellense]MBU3114383.1 vgrg protein [Clostridium lacusfryxellense]
MALSTNLINNELLNQYALQIKKYNTLSTKNTTEDVSEESTQESAFRALLIQMMNNSTGSTNSMMVEFMTTALSNQESLNLDDSLGEMSEFNLNMRNVALSLSSNTSQEVDEYSTLGATSAKYESNYNPGTISNTPGDIGGKSYGAWQFSSKTGSLNSFINSLNQTNKDFYLKLTEAKSKDGNSFGRNFDAAWTSISANNKDEFLKIQKNSIKQNYYDVVATALNTKYGFDINTKSNALKESLLSTAVQHGVGGTLSVFSKLNLNKSDGNIINDLYNERQKVNVYFKDSSAAVKQSVYNRFTKEKQDMISMFNDNSKEKFLTSV